MNLDVRFDCRHYLGYKPCGRQADCVGDCPAYEPRGKRILIIKLGAMGDVLRTTPLLQPLRAQQGPCFITWLVESGSESLLRHNPLIDRVLPWHPDSSLILQAEQFDLLLNFEKEHRAIALDALVHAEEKRGFALHPAGTLGIHNENSRYALQLGIDDYLKFHVNQKTMPQILAEMAELPYAREEYILELNPEAYASSGKYSQIRAANSGRPIIGINTGCGAAFPTKQWPPEHFTALIRRLLEETNAILLLLGGPRERQINSEILSSVASDSLIDTCCDNTLDQFIGIVETCDCVVSSDSLAMHIAIARKKKVVALLGPTSATEIDLFDRGEIIASDLDCAPCYRTRCNRDAACMQSLSSDAVFSAIGRLL